MSVASLSEDLPDVSGAVPLSRIDVSDARLYEHGLWEPVFARLRAEDPVHYCADGLVGSFWSVTKFNDILAVDNNPAVFSSEPSVAIRDAPAGSELQAFITRDGRVHDVQRKAVQNAVAPRTLLQLESLIRQRAGAILDGLPVGETFDWVSRVSIELTTQMLATLFDFPFESRHKLPYWSDLGTAVEEVTGNNTYTPDERFAGLMECAAVFGAMFQERAAHPKPGAMDFLSLLASDPNTRDLPERPSEFLGTMLLLIIGGNDTTRNSISGGVLALNEHPAEYAKLRANPGLIPGMASEIIRWQTPLLHMRRTALQDTELGDKRIRKGDRVVMWYVSGNRDDEVIDRPNEFLIDRSDVRRHLSFGFGPHRCMGNRLAEMQLRVLWEEITNRFDFVEQMGPAMWLRSNWIHGITALPVQVHPKH